MNPYTVLGVQTDADLKEIKQAYRRASAMYHPDNQATGSVNRFRTVQNAYDVLSDPQRRERYDKLGRTDISKVTPDRIRVFIRETIKTTIKAARPDGTRDDPTRENVQDKIRLGLLGARVTLQQEVYQVKLKLERADQLIERFSTTSDFDPVGEALTEERAVLIDQLHQAEDALELSNEVEQVLATYNYKIDPWGGGTVHPQGPTNRSTTGSVMIGGPGTRRTRPSYEY